MTGREQSSKRGGVSVSAVRHQSVMVEQGMLEWSCLSCANALMSTEVWIRLKVKFLICTRGTCSLTVGD